VTLAVFASAWALANALAIACATAHLDTVTDLSRDPLKVPRLWNKERWNTDLWSTTTHDNSQVSPPSFIVARRPPKSI